MQADSKIEATAALSARVAERFFLGAEIRHLRAYQGYFFNDARGWAAFAGPLLHLSIGASGFVAASWSIQVAGRSPAEPLHGLDLVNFERHQVRVKLGFSF